MRRSCYNAMPCIGSVALALQLDTVKFEADCRSERPDAVDVPCGPIPSSVTHGHNP